MINDVRNTVLSIISKDNRGFITPLEFNQFAKQAQLEIFGQYMFNYSNAINKQNARMHGEGYTDIPKNMGEVIDSFSVFTGLTYNNGTNKFNLPVDYFFLEKVIYNNSKEVEKVSNPNDSNYVDFELPLDDFANLVIKILEYAGISIREQDVVSAAKAEEVQDIQQKQ